MKHCNSSLKKLGIVWQKLIIGLEIGQFFGNIFDQKLFITYNQLEIGGLRGSNSPID